MEYLNRQQILLLTEEIGVETTPILLTMFTEELSDYRQTLLAGFENSMFCEQESVVDNLKKISYELKSSASSFGADRLFLLANEIDKQLKANPSSDIKEALLEMLATINETLQHYLGFLQ